MKKRLSVAFFALLLTLGSIGCFAQEVAVLDQLDPIKQSMLDHALVQAEKIDRVFEDAEHFDAYVTLNISSDEWARIAQTDIQSPIRANFLMPTDQFDEAYYWHHGYAKEGASDEGATALRESVSLNLATDFYEYLRPRGDIARLARRTSIDGVVRIEGFEDVAYLTFIYGPDRVQVVTAFCAVMDDLVMTKTAFVYVDSASNYVTIVPSTVGRVYGEEAFAFSVYPIPK